jgi:hypothetical protein
MRKKNTINLYSFIGTAMAKFVIADASDSLYNDLNIMHPRIE